MASLVKRSFHLFAQFEMLRIDGPVIDTDLSAKSEHFILMATTHEHDQYLETKESPREKINQELSRIRDGNWRRRLKWVIRSPLHGLDKRS